MSSRSDAEEARLDAICGLDTVIDLLKIVAEKGADEVTRSDARIAIDVINTLLRENLREHEDN